MTWSRDFDDNGELVLQVRDNLAVVGKGVAVLNPLTMWKLGILDDDVVSIIGRRKTAARCISPNTLPEISGAITFVMEQDQPPNRLDISSDSHSIWLDAVIRENAQVKLGDYIKVRKYGGALLTPAKRVELTAMIEEIPDVNSAILKRWISWMPITSADLILYYKMERGGELKGALYRVTKIVPETEDCVMVNPNMPISVEIVR